MHHSTHTTLCLIYNNHYSTDNSIKNHWNSSMRRKIEKYVAKKQGVDETNIRYTDDGRFDFLGDLEGVLAAVRGKDGSGRGRAKSTGKKRTTRKKLESFQPTPQPLGQLSNMYTGMNHPGMSYLARGGPYGMGHPGMQHFSMMAPAAVSKMGHGLPQSIIAASGKENSTLKTPGSNNAPLSAQPMQIRSMDDRAKTRGVFSFSPADIAAAKNRQHHPDDHMHGLVAPSDMSPFFGMSATPASTLKTPFSADTDFSSNYFSSGKKSIFDSPKRTSPAYGGMHGMTPLSHLQDAFGSTPFTGDMKTFSPNQYADELNKTLFAEDVMSESKRRFIMKTPKARSPKQISFQIGSDLSKGGMDPQLSHVSISPISQMMSSLANATGKDLVLTDDHSPSGQSLAQVSFASVDKPQSRSARNIVTNRKAADDEMKLMPPPSVSFAESRDDILLSSITKGGGILKCSPTDCRDDVSPRNVTLNESKNSHIRQSPFPSNMMGDVPTPSADNSFWRTQFGFSPVNHSLTPFKSPATFSSKQDEHYSPVNGTFRTVVG